jgi:hypothetical protein
MVTNDEVPTSNAMTEVYSMSFGSHMITDELYDEENYVELDDNVVDDYGLNNSFTTYDWVADSTTTSHICNTKHTFIEYTPSHKKLSVCGVGGIIARAEGRGTMKLQTHYQGKTHNIKLKDILYIPDNRNNLLSLGQWARAGNCFTGGTELHLFIKNGLCVVHGPLSNMNLYTINCKMSLPMNKWQYALNSTSASPDWEMWHRRFGHVSYDSLSKLHTHNLTEGFTINKASPKPDCIACIQAKHSEKPFGQHTTRETHPGELTHIDLWGKYEIASINGAYYYLLMIDDTSRHTTVVFLKSKDQAAQRVKEYLTYITTRNKLPTAIRIDRGTEFANADLKSWCGHHGIEIQMTAPYFPFQNGVAE